MKAHLIIGLILIAICTIGMYFCMKEFLDFGKLPTVEIKNDKE